MSRKKPDVPVLLRPWWDAKGSAESPLKEEPELEKKIQGRFLRKAKDRGWRCRRLNGTGAKDWPDVLVIAPYTICLIEFKRPKYGKLSPTQELLHTAFRTLNVEPEYSLVTTSDEEAIKFVVS